MTERALAHDDKGKSEEMCVRCGWVMGRPPLNCQNDDTPHRFPSQLPWLGTSIPKELDPADCDVSDEFAEELTQAMCRPIEP
jgi:hypothetical protein